LSKTLLFGGSFDPIHIGHLIVSRYVAEHLGIERIVLIPAPSPPHKVGRRLAPAGDRLELCRRAVAGDPQFAVSDWELTQPGPSYTLHTIRHFRSGLPAGTDLYFLIGADSLRELGSWHRVGELVEECTVVTAARPSCAPPDFSRLLGPLTERQIEKLRAHWVAGPLIDISATDVRTRVRDGRSIRYLVPEAVAAYISERGLYRGE